MAGTDTRPGDTAAQLGRARALIRALLIDAATGYRSPALRQHFLEEARQLGVTLDIDHDQLERWVAAGREVA